MRFWNLPFLFLLTACGAAAPSPYDASSWKSGWGDSHAPQAGEIYPATFPRIPDADLRRRESELNAAPWSVSLGPSGYLAQASLNVDDGETLSSAELDEAQIFIDSHLALFGLAQKSSLKKWDDGLYYVSPVDDPRFGISVLHRGPRLTIAGHFWPHFTFRSSARKNPSELLRPWLGTRVTSADTIQMMPCDPAGPVNTCPQQSEAPVVTVGPDIARYVVSAIEIDGALEVRELLVIDLPHNPRPVDSGKTLPPFALDARTGEAMKAAALGSGMCEGDAFCVSWNGTRTVQNFMFWHWVSFERLDRDVGFRPRAE